MTADTPAAAIHAWLATQGDAMLALLREMVDSMVPRAQACAGAILRLAEAGP